MRVISELKGLYSWYVLTYFLKEMIGMTSAEISKIATVSVTSDRAFLLLYVLESLVCSKKKHCEIHGGALCLIKYKSPLLFNLCIHLCNQFSIGKCLKMGFVWLSLLFDFSSSASLFPSSPGYLLVIFFNNTVLAAVKSFLM